MKAYELLFIVPPTIDDETRAGVMKRIETTLAESAGVVDNVDNWGKRKLALEARYTLMRHYPTAAVAASIAFVF